MYKLLLSCMLLFFCVGTSAQTPLLNAGERCYLVIFEEKTFSRSFQAYFDIGDERIEGMDTKALQQKFKNGKVSEAVNFMLAHGFELVKEDYGYERSNHSFSFMFRKSSVHKA